MSTKPNSSLRIGFSRFRAYFWLNAIGHTYEFAGYSVAMQSSGCIDKFRCNSLLQVAPLAPFLSLMECLNQRHDSAAHP